MKVHANAPDSATQSLNCTSPKSQTRPYLPSGKFHCPPCCASSWINRSSPQPGRCLVFSSPPVSGGCSNRRTEFRVDTPHDGTPPLPGQTPFSIAPSRPPLFSWSLCFVVVITIFLRQHTAILHPQPSACGKSRQHHNLHLATPDLYTWSAAHVSHKRAPRLTAIFSFSKKRFAISHGKTRDRLPRGALLCAQSATPGGYIEGCISQPQAKAPTATL